MFFSRQLLARKAPLGQIWMAATMHSKLNRRNLNQLDIIQICEQILNPAVPMALRLSGILMGGVVIVYERKVKLLYDDVTRLLVEINQVWKVRPTRDPSPTHLPKGKSRPNLEELEKERSCVLLGREVVKLPENEEVIIGENEESVNYSDPRTMMGFKQTSYAAMTFDNLDEPHINQDPQSDLAQDYHTANAEDITLIECFETNQKNASIHNHFDRFDIEGDDETELNFTVQENTSTPNILTASPPRQEIRHELEEIPEQHPEDQVNQQPDEAKKTQGPEVQGPLRKRVKRTPALVLDYEQTVIPGPIYQSWLQSTSNIISRRGRKRKHFDVMSTIKTSKLMELPPLVLVEKLFSNSNREIHYPTPLLELWRRSTQPPHDSPSGKNSTPQPPETSSSSPAGGLHDQARHGHVSIEKFMENHNNNSELPEGVGYTFDIDNLIATSQNSGEETRSLPSSGSGRAILPHSSDVNSGRPSKKRQYSSSRHSPGSLEAVPEEHFSQSPNFKIARLSEDVFAPETEPLQETGPTQTQKHTNINQPLDPITHSIKKQLKFHFDTPGSSKMESLNQLAAGLNKKRAACLFYQTCVLATRDYIRVDQKVPYGDILISRGPEM